MMMFEMGSLSNSPQLSANFKPNIVDSELNSVFSEIIKYILIVLSTLTDILNNI